MNYPIGIWGHFWNRVNGSFSIKRQQMNAAYAIPICQASVLPTGFPELYLAMQTLAVG
jgi:hypothetical protein